VDIESKIDLSKATIHSYLTTLEQCGLVAKNGMVYNIGSQCLYLAGHARDQEAVYIAGREGADELAQDLGELVVIAKEWDGKCTYLYQSSGYNAMPMDSHLGVRLPMHCTASGKALLSEKPDKEINEIIDSNALEAWTESTITSRAKLLDEIHRIRKQGVAFDDEERISGLRGIGVPIKKKGSLIGTLAMAGPVNRFEGDRYWEDLPEKLNKVRRMVEVKAAYL